MAESKREKRDEGLGRSRAAENKGRIGEVHDNATVLRLWWSLSKSTGGAAWAEWRTKGEQKAPVPVSRVSIYGGTCLCGLRHRRAEVVVGFS